MNRDSNASRRILWLINHTTLREGEVPLLNRMGFEVYTPKHFPRNSDNRSASVTYEFDASLTIPKDALEELNEHDFYRKGISPGISHIINRYFETAIVAYMFPMLDLMVTRFKGRILLRAFGLTDSNHTYYSFAETVIGKGFRRRLSMASERFNFAAGYTNLAEIEPPLVRERTAYLPVGLSPRVLQQAATWVGGDPRILFVCPDINTYSESHAVYETFKRDFGDMPHVICGAQTIPVDEDPNVVGRLDSSEYTRLFRECSVLFYHSELPRHIHYHPVEAACYGMPVVYMSKGMLGMLGGKDLPGAADTIQEAREKVQRVCDPGEKAFRTKVIESQSKIVEHFLPATVEQTWRHNFKHGVMSRPLPQQDPLKIGILVCDPMLSSVRHAAEVVDAINMHQRNSDLKHKLTVGICSNDKEDFCHKTFPHSVIRDFQWYQISPQKIETISQVHGISPQLVDIPVSVPEDNICQFLDCDVWLLVGDLSHAAILPMRPTACWARKPLAGFDFKSQRLRKNMSYNLQNSSAVLCTSSQDGSKILKEFTISSDILVNVNALESETITDSFDIAAILKTLEAIA